MCTVADVEVMNNNSADLVDRISPVTSPGDKLRQHKLQVVCSEADIEVVKKDT
jgi:hypothetical protein